MGMAADAGREQRTEILRHRRARQRPGHEYQLIDDSQHADALRGAKWQTAAFYDVLPATNRTIKPVGEWNQARVLVEGNHVEHWLNGAKVLEYELGSET